MSCQNKNIIKENYAGTSTGCPDCFDYFPLDNLPSVPQPYGAGFGQRSIRDVMEWKMTMGDIPYPWGPDGQKFIFNGK